jgi:CBS-domain-containing membrane protein
MTVAKIMRKDVVTLHAEGAIEAAWRQMREHRLSALPVIDKTEHLVGMLSEQDLLGRLTPRPAHRWWHTILAERDRLAADYVKAVGLTVGDLMTAPPVAIGPDASVDAAATLMHQHAIGALPVVADGLYIGLVIRADVLDHLPWPTPTTPDMVPDAKLERSMREAIQREPWTESHVVFIEATQGIIQLTGVLSSPMERKALVAMAQAVPGCGGVDDRLVVLIRRGGHLAVS